MQRAARHRRVVPLLLAVAVLVAGEAMSGPVCRGVVPPTECRIEASEFDAAVARWEKHLRDRGHRLGQTFLRESIDSLNTPPRAWYYDAQRVFLLAADRFGDQAATWHRYAERAESAYETYVRSGTGVPGYERFPHGLALDHERNDDPESLVTLRILRDRGPFADVLANPGATTWYRQAYSREVAYMIDTHVTAERAGLARQDAALARYVDMALEHIRIWTTGDYRTDNPRWRFCQPFMAGLTASALIDYHRLTEETGAPDSRIPNALRGLGDWLIEHAWVPNHDTTLAEQHRPRLYGSFRYVVPATSEVGDDTPAPDLNLLIAPLYAWLWRHTGDTRYQTVGDTAFVGGVHLAWLERAKTFNQNYRSSFDFLAWRGNGPVRGARSEQVSAAGAVAQTGSGPVTEGLHSVSPSR